MTPFLVCAALLWGIATGAALSWASRIGREQRERAILIALAAEGECSAIDLARLQLSWWRPGVVNALLRRLVARGFISAREVPGQRARFQLTLRGCGMLMAHGDMAPAMAAMVRLHAGAGLAQVMPSPPPGGIPIPPGGAAP